ncbi:hypothetical protein C7457_0052 [Thermovibrio guaymasensis]|uniref:DUF2232 domain-containing protein n=1 Tax=Thermovibrio guaymasensis TaxID=240167 RepID=A0A420W799_9BACT|nr:hypothetical protein [Thermovibrio guaymasensis]RKQ63189.1 hypothetical protein C7457_0052 [Thermovibrio guaymasensis]
MKGLKASAIYGLITVLTGITAESSQWVLLSAGLSLFIPALLLISIRENTLLALLTSVTSLGILALYSLRAPFEVLPFQVIGVLFSRRYKKPELSLLIATVILFSAAVVEELLLGLPPEVKDFPFYAYRWGVYFFTALLFSEATYGIALLTIRKGEIFLKINFGFWPVPLFLVLGALSLIPDFFYRELVINGLIATLSLFAGQGIPIMLYLINRVSPLIRLIILITVVIFPLGFLTAAVILGFLDNWLNFRKLNEGGEDGSNST